MPGSRVGSVTARKRGERYSPEAWAAKEALAARKLAQCGSTIATVRDAIRGMPGAGADEEALHRSAVLTGINVGGPPATDEAMRSIAPIFGMVLAADLGPRGERRAS